MGSKDRLDEDEDRLFPRSEVDEYGLLRIEGGFVGALQAAIAALWENALVLLLLNLLWTAALVSIVLLPPATVAVYYVAREALLHRPVGWQTFWRALRRHFFVAWRWGATLFLAIIIVVANLWLYGEATGVLWIVLRALWIAILLLVLFVNLFFWPFWFSQRASHRALRATWRNCLVFTLLNPISTLLTVLIFVLSLGLSYFVPFLLPTLFMTWLALLTTAVLAAYLPQEGAT